MNNATLKRVVLVYLVLIPVMWLFTEIVGGGLHGALGGLRIGKALQTNPQTAEEIMAFLKQHGFSENASRKESQEWFNKLTMEEQAEFKKILMKSVDINSIAGFGSTFAVCVIVFGGIGFLSGLLTKTWIYVGIFPIVSFLINNPVVRFSVIRDMPVSQKVTIVVASQFLASYAFAFIGATLSIKVAERRRKKMEAKL